MTTEGAIDLLRRAFWIAALVAGPMVIASLIVGVIVGVMQAATQINEASVSFVLKLLAVTVTFALAGAWSLEQLVTYTRTSFQSLETIVR
jgi:flagellar biosynthesis protein FliQ